MHALWDSWEDDAFVGDKASARSIDTSKVHAINHRGAHYSVDGPLNIPRSPQGRPVTVQAGGSSDGRDLAAAQADAVFTLSQSIEEGVSYARDLRARAHRLWPRVGFDHDPAAAGDRDRQHRGRSQTASGQIWHLVPISFTLARLAGTLQVSPDILEFDKPLPDLALLANANQTMFKGTVALARRDNLTVRQLLKALGGGVGHRIIVGTPEAIAKDIEAWCRAGAADGFNLMPDVLPTGLDVFVDEVVPLLQKRGDYEGTTLRDHFGLERPPSRYARREATAA